jgi:hypothetical protein
MGFMWRAMRQCRERPEPLPNGEIQDGPSRVNERIAVWATHKFGTMWAAYLFAAYGMIPIAWASLSGLILYWSNWIQLWSLPLIMVGTAVIGRATERRIVEIHAAIMGELEMEREQLQQLALIVDHLKLNQRAELQQLSELQDIAMATQDIALNTIEQVRSE